MRELRPLGSVRGVLRKEHSYRDHFLVALSIKLIVAMELFLNRSVKISHLAALTDREN